MTINADFECGNIIVESITASDVALSIRADSNAKYFQWFYFKDTPIQGIERRYRAPNKTERLQALARIEEHRQAFLARRNQTPLNIEPTELLRQAREDRVDHLFNVLEEHMHDRG